MRNKEIHALFDKAARTVDSLATRMDAFAANAEATDKRAEAQREADREEHKERLVAEAEERKARRKQVDKEMKALRELFGGMGNSMGDITEEFFYNSLSARPILKGMRFDKVLPNRERTRNGLTGEFDLILLNSHDVFLNEVKFKARERDLELLVGKQARVFRELYPEYGNRKLHLGLASFHFDESLIAKCLASGVTVLQRVGNVLEAQYPPGKSLKGQPILLH